jgi:MFS superfamily sulfate permease-like transporter
LIPTASLAAVLVYTGFKLVNPKIVRELQKFGRSEVLIYVATILAIVGEDLLTGVLVGIGLSIAKLLITFSHLHIHTEDDPAHGRTQLHLEGTATFLRLPKLAATLEAVPTDRELHVHFEHLDYIDHACLDLLMNWGKQHQATGGRLVIDWEDLTERIQARPNGNGHRPNGNGNGHRRPAPCNGNMSLQDQAISCDPPRARSA